LSGFAELNAEVEETYGDQMHQQLPFRVISSYVHFTFFQEEKPPLVTEPLGSSGRSRDFVQGLSDFKRLLSDKKFLLTVVATLEEKKSFDISNRWVWWVCGVRSGCGTRCVRSACDLHMHSLQEPVCHSTHDCFVWEA
jgi:hypothetical protein